MKKTMTNISIPNTLSLMGSCYYCFTFARFFAGFFGVPSPRICQGHT